MMIFIRPLIGDVSHFITITALDSFWGHHHKAPSSIVHITNAVHSLFFQAMCFHSLLMTRHKWIHIWKFIDLPRTVYFLAKGGKASKPNLRSLCEKRRFQICNLILVAFQLFLKLVSGCVKILFEGIVNHLVRLPYISLDTAQCAVCTITYLPQFSHNSWTNWEFSTNNRAVLWCETWFIAFY